MARRSKLGARILKAVASPIRLRILRLLLERNFLSYTEIMSSMKLIPNRDAGRFAYHLKTLTNMDLIELESNSKKYHLTELGKTVVEFTDDLESNTYQKKMLIRTSRLAIENFDRNKIAESLCREAEVPAELAQKTAREAEKRLLKLRTKYLTAPLIREFVNAILIERGFEDYRHKLTRLGFPVYDVSNLLKELGDGYHNVQDVELSAGNRVIEEYTLLNSLPRDVADAHISGSLCLNNLGSWILRAECVMHDMRYFFKHGLYSKQNSVFEGFLNPPKDLRTALLMISDVLNLSSPEVSGEQGIDYFNVFLSPFVDGLSENDIRKELQSFLTSVGCTVSTKTSVSIEQVVPDCLLEAKAFGPNGETGNSYGDYLDKSILIARLLLEILEEEKEKPLLNPNFIMKLRSNASKSGDAEDLLHKAHTLAAQGMLYFANLTFEGQTNVSYTSNGLRFADDWKGDWEIDSIRTLCMDRVTLNLPRVLYDSEKDKNKFFENLQNLSEKALRALHIKYNMILNRFHENLLPFLIQKNRNDPYIRADNSTCILSFVGLSESVLGITGEELHKSKRSLSFGEEIASYLDSQAKDYSKKNKIRFALGLTANLQEAKRLAGLDIEKYGLGEVKLQMGREKPFYTNTSLIPYLTEIPLQDAISVEAKFHSLTPGSHLARIPIDKTDCAPDDLLLTTKRILNESRIGLFIYERRLTFCSNCQRTFHGEHLKCPLCSSTKTVTRYSRVSA